MGGITKTLKREKYLSFRIAYVGGKTIKNPIYLINNMTH